MKMNPVYKKELKISIRSIRTAVLLFGYNGLLALFGLLAFYITFEYDSNYGGTVNYSDILRIYALITSTEFGLVSFIIPAMTCSSISGEREKQTLDTLLTSRLSPLQIILGKLTSSISMMLLLVFSSLPIIALTFTIGGITFQDLLGFMASIVVTAVFIGSIGIFYSTLFKKTSAATVFTYATLLVIGIGTVIILYGITILMKLQLNTLASADGVKINPNAGNWILILLINPAISCFSMIEEQIGTGSRLTAFFHKFGTISNGLQNYWFIISMALQLTVSAVLIGLSSCLLNPLRKHFRK